MSFPERMSQRPFSDASAKTRAAASAGAAVLLIVALGGAAVGLSTCSSQPALVVAGADESVEGGASNAQDDSADASAGGEGRQAASAEASDAGPDIAPVAVYVSGAVVAPGVYELADGSRVCDAVDAAGGLRDDAAADAVNLARRIADGEQVSVPTKDQVESGQGAPVAAVEGVAPASPSLVNINTADVGELDALAGIGPATAQAIVDEREANGPFASVEDIMRVSGIGEKKFAKLREGICV